jgi:hypothetical protein
MELTARRALFGAVLLAAGGCGGAGPPPAGDPVDRALACVARSYDGDGFDDPYLRYVYPGERLESPLPGHRVTYRNLDAYFIVLMLQDAGVDPGPARDLFDRADRLAKALVPLWRRRGIYNLRRSPAPGGIALDTYAILARLERDAEMARVVLEGLDGEGWLPANLYTGSQAFRRVADESWAARALAVTGVAPDAAARIVTRICADARAGIESGRDPLARANLALHALDALRDLPAPAPDLAGARAFLASAAREMLDDPAVRANTLTFANLIGALAIEPSTDPGDLRPMLDELTRRQEPDGCWQESLDGPRGAARVFATLRCALALARRGRRAAGPA